MVFDGWTIAALIVITLAVLIFVYRWGRRDGYYEAMRDGFGK